MNIAITIWGDRISPVFDSAQTLMVVGVDGGQITDKKIVSFRSDFFTQFLGLLEEKEVRILICGALCKGPVKALESRGVVVFPFMTGEVEKVLEIFMQGADLSECFMPGCGNSRCCRTAVCVMTNRKIVTDTSKITNS